jgi:hypothetical protein
MCDPAKQNHAIHHQIPAMLIYDTITNHLHWWNSLGIWNNGGQCSKKSTRLSLPPPWHLCRRGIWSTATQSPRRPPCFHPASTMVESLAPCGCVGIPTADRPRARPPLDACYDMACESVGDANLPEGEQGGRAEGRLRGWGRGEWAGNGRPSSWMDSPESRRAWLQGRRRRSS